MEIQAAPDNVQKLFATTFDMAAQILPLTSEAETLARAYLSAKVVSPNYADDARHVAIATVEQVSLIVSWNFKHLANYQRETGFNGVNLLQGYRSVRILTPLELIYGDQKKAFDAVAKSHHWKEAVARKTAGMNSLEVLAFFNRDKVLARMATLRKKSSCVVPAH